MISDSQYLKDFKNCMEAFKRTERHINALEQISLLYSTDSDIRALCDQLVRRLAVSALGEVYYDDL